MKLLDETPIYYVYEHYKPNCDEPFYVGKGADRRAYSLCARNKWWHNIVNKHGFEVRFVAENLSEMDAFWLENMCINGWGRASLKDGPLVNMTDGGDGMSGYKWPAARRKCQSGENSSLFGRTGNKNYMFGKTGNKHPSFGKKGLSGSKHGMFGKTGENSPMFGKFGKDAHASKPVQTPLGIFESVIAAAKAHDVCSSAMTARCQKNIKGCSYI